MASCSKLEPSRISQVGEQLQSYEALMEELGMTLDTLQARLLPILNNDQPTAVSVDKGPPPPSIVPLAETLRTCNFRLHAKIMMIKDIINSLEI
jgi:hypothetical protein